MRVGIRGVFYSLLLVALLSLSNAAVYGASTILINEVAFGETGGTDWVELYCVDDDSGAGVDIQGYCLTDLDGTDLTLTTKPVTMYATDREITSYDDRYVVVHWENNADDETDITGDTNGNGYLDLYIPTTGVDFTATDDQCALDTDTDYSNGGILDAVCWSNNDDTFSEASDINNYLATTQWPSAGNTAVEFNAVCWTNSDEVDAGESIGRDSSSTDTNNKDDWHHFITGTPGEANPSGGSSGDILINEVAPSESGGADWVELYNASGSSKNIQYWAVKERSTKVKTLPDLTMAAGEYLVLHFNSSTADETDATGDTNENGYWDVYTTDTGLVGTDNVVVLYDPVNAIIDAMAWSNVDGTWATAQQTAFNTIVNANEWAGTVDGGVSVNEPECAPGSGAWDETAGHSLGRDISSTDNNDRDDWFLDATPTMGRNNGSAPISARITNLRVSNDPFFADGSDLSRKDTTISFNLAVDSEVSIRVYDAEGRVVKTLMDNSLRPSGKSEVIWDGRDGSGGVVPIGTYVISVEAASLDDQSNDGAIITVIVARSLSSDEFECFIATAVYSSSTNRPITILRRFRDECLLSNRVGRVLVRIYYRASPPVANFIRERESLKAVVRVMLWPVVKFAKLVLGR